MKNDQYLKNLTVPQERVDVVLDTDAHTEVDDLYAISYLVKHEDKFNVKGICAAPFFKHTVSSIEEGIEKSYYDIQKILELAKRDDLKELVFKGSKEYLADEKTPVESDAANYLSELCNKYSPAHPLYVVAIGALTNIASAMLKNLSFKENCVVIWLGGHAVHMPNAADEYNLRNDIAAARIVFGSKVPLVLLPCNGVVDRFLTSEHELSYWIKGKNELCDYLFERTVEFSEKYYPGKPWSRVIWDVTAVAWLLNDRSRFMRDYMIPCPIPEYDKQYAFDPDRHLIKNVIWINRDTLFADLFETLVK